MIFLHTSKYLPFHSEIQKRPIIRPKARSLQQTRNEQLDGSQQRTERTEKIDKENKPGTITRTH